MTYYLWGAIPVPHKFIPFKIGGNTLFIISKLKCQKRKI